MTKHTPGPWLRYPNSINSLVANAVVVRLPEYTDCFGDESPEQLERWDSDARLIAAAPELLEALEKLDSYFSSPGEDCWVRLCDAVLEPARAAIAKAKGENP